MKTTEMYDKKFLLWCLGNFLAVCLIMKISGGNLFALFIPMIMSSLIQRKTEKLFFWLLTLISVLIVNSNIAPKGMIFAVTQRGLMVVIGICMSVQVFGRRKHKIIAPFMGMIAYVLYMCLPSFLGWCPIVSFLKLFLFTVIYFSFLGAVNLVGGDLNVSSHKLRSIMLTFAIVFLFGSVALLPFPALSQMKADAFVAAQEIGIELKSLYCGMANHSQCLGPVVSTLSILLLGDMLFSVKRANKLYVALLLVCPYLVYKTSSRTGMGALILGLLFVIYLFSRAREVSSGWKSKIMTATMLIAAVCACCIMMSSRINVGIQKFITKSVNAGDVSKEQVLSSRMGLVENALENFHKSPMIGNGFQVSERMIGFTVHDVRQILSAPIEKGVWFAAVLEEGGVFGIIIFIGLFLVCILSSIRNRAYIGAAELFTLLTTNLGEFSMFSMSYSGGFSWAMVFMGLAMDIRRNAEERQGFVARSYNTVGGIR